MADKKEKSKIPVKSPRQTPEPAKPKPVARKSQGTYEKLLGLGSPKPLEPTPTVKSPRKNYSRSQDPSAKKESNAPKSEKIIGKTNISGGSSLTKSGNSTPFHQKISYNEKYSKMLRRIVGEKEYLKIVDTTTIPDKLESYPECPPTHTHMQEKVVKRSKDKKVDFLLSPSPNPLPDSDKDESKPDVIMPRLALNIGIDVQMGKPEKQMDVAAKTLKDYTKESGSIFTESLGSSVDDNINEVKKSESKDNAPCTHVIEKKQFDSQETISFLKPICKKELNEPDFTTDECYFDDDFTDDDNENENIIKMGYTDMAKEILQNFKSQNPPENSTKVEAQKEKSMKDIVLENLSSPEASTKAERQDKPVKSVNPPENSTKVEKQMEKSKKDIIENHSPPEKLTNTDKQKRSKRNVSENQNTPEKATKVEKQMKKSKRDINSENGNPLERIMKNAEKQEKTAAQLKNQNPSRNVIHAEKQVKESKRTVILENSKLDSKRIEKNVSFVKTDINPQDEPQGITDIEQPEELDSVVSDVFILDPNVENRGENCSFQSSEENKNQPEEIGGRDEICTGIRKERERMTKEQARKLQLQKIRATVTAGNRILDEVEGSMGWWKGVFLALLLAVVIPSIIFIGWCAFQWRCDTMEPPDPTLIGWIYNLIFSDSPDEDNSWSAWFLNLFS